MTNITQYYFAFSFLFISLMSCKKDDTDEPANTNEVNATVVLSSGGTVTISAKGTKAILGLSSPLGGPGYIDGTNSANAAVYINLYPAITMTGTFGFNQGYTCQYRPDVTSMTSPIYTNSGIDPGSITITTVNDHYLEGSFSAICRYQGDSVIVSGTFKGNTIGK